MAIERIVSSKHFSGNYTNDEIRALFTEELDIALGEVIIFNDKINPTIYFLDDEGNLVSIQKTPVVEGGDLDGILSEIRSLRSDFNDLQIIVINNKEELDLKIAGLQSRIESLEESDGNGVSEEIQAQIDKNTEDIVSLKEKDNEFDQRIITVENKLFLFDDVNGDIEVLKQKDIELTDEIEKLSLKDVELNTKIKDLTEEVEENELVHSVGLNILNNDIKKLDERLKSVEDGNIDIDIDFTEIENRISTNETNISELSGTTVSIEERLKSVEEGNVDIDLSGIENDIELLKTDVNDINETISTIDERLATIEESGIDSINNKIDALEKKDIEITTSISSLKSNEIAILNSKVSNLENTDKLYNERITELEKIDLTPLVEDIDKLQEHSTLIDLQISEISGETSDLKAILSDLKEEVEENEIVHSAGLNVLNQEINNLKDIVENIEGGDIAIDLTEVNEKIDIISGNTISLDERVKAIEEGNIDIDLTDIENTLTAHAESINSLNEKDIDFEERITTLENVEPIDLSSIEKRIGDNETNISNLQTFDENISKQVETISKVSNNALSAANESVKNINSNGDNYINITSSVSDRQADISINTNIVKIDEASTDNDGLVSSFDVKSEMDELISLIGAYTVNGKEISGNPVLNTDDMNIDEDYLSKKPEDSQSILPNDELTLALAKLEKKLDNAIQIFSAALNDINDRLDTIENNNVNG